MKNQHIQIALENLRNDQEEKKQEVDESEMKGVETNENGGNRDENQLTPQQMEVIEKEVQKRIKKERTLDGGVKNLKEKAPFHF